MEYLELEQLINDGALNVGDDVWMMHLQFQRGHITFKRNLPPTKVRISPYQRRLFREVQNHAFHEVKRNGEPRVNPVAPTTAGGVGRNPEYDAQYFLTEAEADAEYTLKCGEVENLIMDDLDQKIRILTDLVESTDARRRR